VLVEPNFPRAHQRTQDGVLHSERPVTTGFAGRFTRSLLRLDRRRAHARAVTTAGRGAMTTLRSRCGRVAGRVARSRHLPGQPGAGRSEGAEMIGHLASRACRITRRLALPTVLAAMGASALATDSYGQLGGGGQGTPARRWRSTVSSSPPITVTLKRPMSTAGVEMWKRHDAARSALSSAYRSASLPSSSTTNRSSGPTRSTPFRGSSKSPPSVPSRVRPP
jgi:hypothetical protein